MNLPPHKWLSPPKNLDLKDDDETHLWRIDLNRKSANAQISFEILSSDERRRAEKYHFEKDKNHFINTRAALRQILSRYLDIAPNQIEFSANQYGKPELNIENLDASLEFNFSSSRKVALCAVTRKRRIGIDIEFINDESASAEIAERFFSPDEISALKDISEPLQAEAFFSVWTRKEAFIKAVGKGLSYPLQNFSVSIRPDEITPSLTINDSLENNNYSLFSFSPHPDYAAALAVEGDLPTLRFWQQSENSAV